jgi:hypothetical protein
MVGQTTASRMVELNGCPDVDDPLGCLLRAQAEDHPDIGQRDADLAKRGNQACLVARKTISHCRVG